MIVAFDAASTDLSVALRHNGERDVAWTSARRQSAELLPRLLELLDAEGRRLQEVTAVAVGTGPGSFTGLRVAMALAKGLALALRIPIVGVPSLVAWLEAEPEAEAAVARAGAREAYLLPHGESTVRILDRDELVPTVVGRRLVAPAELAEAFGFDDSIAPARSAAAIARMAAARLVEGWAGDDLERLEPVYLRSPRGVDTEATAEVRWL